MGYADTTKRPPKTLTEVEQAALLKVTGEHRAGFRDHVLFAVALGTGLRVAEIVGLDVGDVSADGRRARRRVALRVFKRSFKDGGTQEVFLPDALVYKLEKFLRWKAARGESPTPDAPLFVSRNHRRLSPGMASAAFSPDNS